MRKRKWASDMQEVFEKIMEEIKEKSYEIQLDGAIVAATKKVAEVPDIVNIVNKISEEYNNGWIPCSDRLPKVEDLHEKMLDNCTCYLIQRRCGIMDVAHYIKAYGESYFEANSIKMIDVVAWKNLPGPYQPKGE